MTHAELYAITAQGPAVIMVARDDMLALLARVERAEAGLAAAVLAERKACAAMAHTVKELDPEAMRLLKCQTSGAAVASIAAKTTKHQIAAAIRARGTT